MGLLLYDMFHDFPIFARMTLNKHMVLELRLYMSAVRNSYTRLDIDEYILGTQGSSSCPLFPR
jgi:hypothetical protein